MKTALPRSFYIIRGIVYSFLLMSALGGAFLIFGILIPAIYQDKPLALNYHTEKIDLNISEKTANGILSLEYFHFDPLTKHQEGDLTLHSKTGKSYEAYYSPKVEKLGVTIPADFAEDLQTSVRIFHIYSLSIMFAFLYFIVKVLTSLEDGSPFIMKNAKYIRAAAAIILFSTFIHFSLNWMLESYIESELGLVFQMKIDVNFVNEVAFAIVLAILSYVLKQGVRMKEEQDLTI